MLVLVSNALPTTKSVSDQLYTRTVMTEDELFAAFKIYRLKLHTNGVPDDRASDDMFTFSNALNYYSRHVTPGILFFLNYCIREQTGPVKGYIIRPPDCYYAGVAEACKPVLPERQMHSRLFEPQIFDNSLKTGVHYWTQFGFEFACVYVALNMIYSARP